ncbi:MAG: hypothetical protein K2J39_05270 [Ruminococcus sp.]|nr:hypothetical protein [Ruminococcus sp.]
MSASEVPAEISTTSDIFRKSGVKAGDTVKITDVIGVEGNTGYSFGSHCHYCVRPQFSAGNAYNVSEISGIPNVLGVYDDGYAIYYKNNLIK